MPIIKQMDPKLANMIAAGEVVDRPASIVKELVENAIDAKATSITVEIEEVGMKKIKVTDNGSGMDKEDARMAFFRHATSKISHEHDLSHIKTLGFRGEALAAIASVSKVTLKTRPKNEEGHFIHIEASAIKSQGSASLNEGTEIEVLDLFYNTPARFKYIKSEMAEKMQIVDIFERLALSNPSIRFKLLLDNQIVKETYGTHNYKQLIGSIYGNKLIENIVSFETIVQKIKIKGFLLAPEINRSRKKDISLFINGRYIKNYALIQAVIEGYHGFMMVNRYPIAIIIIEMDASLLDVNVHPQKYEVKLANESLLGYHIEKLIQETLKNRHHAIPKALEQIKKPNQENYNIQSLDFETIAEEQKYTFDSQESIQKLPAFDYVGTFQGTYLLFQNAEGLFLMDQHAAAERIRYEHYYKALAEPKKMIKMNIIPYEATLTDADKELLLAHKSIFESYGFLINDEALFKGFPTWLQDQEIDLAIESMLTMIAEEKNINLAKLRDTLAKDISCKGAIKANKALSLQEIETLVRNLRNTENPYTCPHGRPTIIKLTNHDIERMFKRVV
jgi:DNA mismatch repair protein MutL